MFPHFKRIFLKIQLALLKQKSNLYARHEVAGDKACNMSPKNMTHLIKKFFTQPTPYHWFLGRFVGQPEDMIIATTSICSCASIQNSVRVKSHRKRLFFGM